MAIYTLFHHERRDQEHVLVAERASAAGQDVNLGASPRVVTTGGNSFPSNFSGDFCPAYGPNPSAVDCTKCEFKFSPCCLLGGEAA